MPSTTRVQDLVAVLDQWFPAALAESWDNVGLLLGDHRAAVTRVMTCLTVTEETALEAVREEADLVIAHHPIFFSPAKTLLANGPDRPVYMLARTGVSVYSPHTAHDSARLGVNEQIAGHLGLTNVAPIRPARQAERFKLITFVPEDNLAAVERAVFDAGAGRIGEYSECSFRSVGTGSFRGSDQTNPTVGAPGQREDAPEVRFEVVLDANQFPEVVAALVHAHVYEEPAYDIFPLVSPALAVGAGRIGTLPKPVPLAELATTVKSALASPLVQFVGPAGMPCQKVGIGCGSAGDMIGDARRAGADVFITGEARFHDMLAARDAEIGLIVAGHDATERFAMTTLADRLREQFRGLIVWASRDETCPLHVAGS